MVAQHPNAHVALGGMRGAGIDLVYIDYMHTKFLGTDQHLLGGAMLYMVKSILAGPAEDALQVMLTFIKEWLSRNSPNKKTVNHLTMGMIDGKPLPKFNAKASEVKGTVKPLAIFIQGYVAAHPELGDVVKLLTLSFSMDELLDNNRGWKLPSRVAQKFERMVLGYNVLLTNVITRWNNAGRPFFHFVPKNHSLVHIAMQASILHPRVSWNFKGEDLMMKLKMLSVSEPLL